MRKRNGKLILSAALICLNVAFIWGNSMMPGEMSSQVSNKVMLLITSILEGIFPEGSDGMFLLRKLAHFTEFLLLGMNFCWLFLLLEQTGIHRFALPMLCGSLAACVDETIQIYSPGRYSSLLDVWIDIGGVTAGIMLLLLGHSMLTMYQKRKQHHFGG